MKRDKYFEKEKFYNYLRREHARLFEETRKKINIPLEKPQFAGWDISIEFTESGKRRKDYPELKEILDLISRSNFTKNVSFIKHIRRNNYSVESIYSYYKSGKFYNSYFSWNILTKSILKKYYDVLKPELLKYFSKEPYKDKYSNTRYSLNNFPLYELKVKITKSYYYSQDIPNSEAESEDAKLHNIIYGRGIENKVWNLSNNYRDSNKISLKRSRKKLCDLYKKYYNEGILNDDTEVEIDTISGSYDKKDYGWS